MLEIVVTSNSPGEVAAWVKPAVKSLKESYPESRINVFLPPCVFASGSEKKVLENFKEIDRVYDKREYLKYILLGRKPRGFEPYKRGVVIFLGGDLFHAAVLGRKLGFPVIAYTEGVFSWASKIARFMVPDQRVKKKILDRGAEKEQVEVIGNLMIDAIEPEMEINEARDFLGIGTERVITLFPGSRLPEVEYMLPFFLKSISDLSTCTDNIKFFLSCSPFVSSNQLKDIFEKYLKNNDIEGEYIIRRDKNDIIKIGDRTRIDVYADFQYDLMQVTDLALTIPGTNNVELAYFGTPMVVVLPLNEPERIPLEGLVGLVGRVPILGPLLMKNVVPRMAEKIEYAALINTVAEKEVVPELKGILNPIDLTIFVEQLLGNKKKLEEMKQQLKEVTSIDRGASDRIVRVVDQVLASFH